MDYVFSSVRLRSGGGVLMLHLVAHPVLLVIILFVRVGVLTHHHRNLVRLDKASLLILLIFNVLLNLSLKHS